MRLTYSLQQSALHHPERLATVCGDRMRTYAEVIDRVARLASGLRAQGAKAGDRIAILALNSDAHFEAYYAILWAGCLAVPCNNRWTAAEHAAAFADCEPSFVLIDDNFVEMLEHLPADLRKRVIALGAGNYAKTSTDRLIADSGPMQDDSSDGDAPAAIFYTGGTTGKSKGAVLSHNNLIVNFLATTAVEPYERPCVYLHVAPMFHLADATMAFGVTMIAGTHVFVPRFDPAMIVKAIAEHGVNTLVLVPTMIAMLDQYLREQPHRLTNIRRLTYGASPISTTLMGRTLVLFPNARITQAYGQTELSPVVTLLSHEHHLPNADGKSRIRSAGRAIPGVEVRVVDQDGSPMLTGGTGEIVVRGPNVMLGYWRNPELTAQTIVDGWIKTGDAGYLDEDGFLFLVDRVKDMIVSGGENVYSVEVENALAQHPAVLECAVIGVPDPQWGERVHAVLRFRPNTSATEDELTAHCAKLIAGYKRPRSFEFRAAPLPLSGAGKILKTELRKPFWKDAARAIS
ncbi:MAG TPA: long-chain-fatty-acid--CoA ligase [Rhizomicrobium sp.]|jgi:long-chain acyl-CoA synthetase